MDKKNDPVERIRQWARQTIAFACSVENALRTVLPKEVLEQNWITALDLFDRRYRVYRGLMDLFSAVATNGNVSNEELGNFYRETDQKRFLFGDDICDYLKLVREKVVKLRQAHRLLEARVGRPIPEKRLDESSEMELDLLAWFDEQFEQAGAKFQRDLGFKKNL